jgi:predicted esterase
MRNHRFAPLGAWLVFALTAATGTLTAQPAADLPRGQVIPKIVTAADPAQSYALYIPSSYRPDRPSPILYALDARANGPEVARIFQMGAERFGFVVASSNNSMSDAAMEPNFLALRAMWSDTHARLALDDRRVYAAGYSGTVRAACTLAFAAPGTIAGIIGAGAGFPFDRPPAKDTPFLFYGTVGDEDFNYQELLDLDRQLTTLGLPHHVEVFEGTHDWPPAELAARALGWMELQAMRAGTRPKRPELVEALWREETRRAGALETSGQVWRAHRAWKAVAADFAGLRDTAEATQKATEIENSEALRRDLAAREIREKNDKAYLEEAKFYMAAVNPSGEPVTPAQVVAALKVHELKRKAQAAEDPEERLSAKRLLNTIAGQTASYLPQSFAERGQWDRVIFVLSIATEINPENPFIWYNRAAAYAHKKDRKRALADLRRAVEAGWTDAARLEGDEAFAPLRKEEGYRKLVEELKAKPGGATG